MGFLFFMCKFGGVFTLYVVVHSVVFVGFLLFVAFSYSCLGFSVCRRAPPLKVCFANGAMRFPLLSM